MKKRIFRSMCLLSAVVVLLTATLISVLVYNGSFRTMQNDVRMQAAYIQAGIEAGGDSFFERLRLDGGAEQPNRVTLIAPDGEVLFDSAADSLQNHLDRPEVQSAFRTGAGEDSRMSATLSTQTYYYAVRLENGSVLRVAGTMDSVFIVWLGALPAMAFVAAVVFALSLFLAGGQTKRIVRPINQLDLEAPVENDVYDELSPLLSRIEAQNHLIRAQMDALRAKQLDFEAITENMSEGMLLIDPDGKILSYNGSAQRILDAGDAGEASRSFLVWNRSAPFQSAVEKALSGAPAEETLPLEGRVYQLLANPVKDNEKIQGVVVLLLDVTERQQREQLRREFSANVSHELKTPLNVVSGYAELMQNGLVPPGDVPAVAGNIYREAQRLITLIGDILKLSQLDEGAVNLTRAPTDLYQLARTTVERLRPAAEARHITLSLEGKPTFVEGVPQILGEMVFNLCDNAVKYNREGGRADVRVAVEQNRPVIEVADTGIGIPEGEQGRVFERFYRVDKSHSRKIGGTGLGLSIVKHGAALHGAEISLSSAEGRGTTIRITFPKRLV